MTRPFFTRRHEDPLLPCGLHQAELDMLAAYNAERSRGLVHDDEWRVAMADLQRRFDDNQRRDRAVARLAAALDGESDAG